MIIHKKSWMIFAVSALIGSLGWFFFSYPDVSFVNLSIDKTQALSRANDFIIQNKEIDPSRLQHAIILNAETDADRYLQKTIGFQAQKDFFKKNDFDLFFWSVRFFKENEKEEFRLRISSSTGEVIGFHHILENTAKRENHNITQEQENAQKFLSRMFGFNLSNYEFKETNVKKHDHRTDYSFVWNKKGVDIPWSLDPQNENAKLLTRVTISGGDILGFHKNAFLVPDDFSRNIEKNKQSGRIIVGIFMFLYYLLIMAATFFVVLERHHLAMQKAKNFVIGTAVFLFFLILLHNINNFEHLLFSYPTTSSLKVYFIELILPISLAAFLFSMTFVMPALAGEAVLRKNSPENKTGGFLHYLLSSFLSRNVFWLVILGYLTAAIMLGLQSIILYLGRQNFGVWIEKIQIPLLSSTYFPFLTALIIGVRASLIEETTFRVFGIHWGKKIFKHSLIAAMIMSIIWGFGHAHYPIFPMWFRSIEVTILGFLLSYVYLTYGIIPVLTAHYLFDAFWGSAGFLFGKSQPVDFYGCLIVILLPLMFAVIAFFKNKSDEERPLSYCLGSLQKYNANILFNFLNSLKDKSSKNLDKTRKDLLKHGWDPAVVEQAFLQTDQRNY